MDNGFDLPIIKLTEVEDRSKSNSRRIEKLENDFMILNRLASSVEVLATEQKNMYGKINSIDAKVSDLEKIPSARWNTVVGYIISALVSAFITWLLTGNR